MLRRLYYILATIGYAGYFPVAPGTVGSFIAALFVYLVKPSDLLLLVLALLCLVVGGISADSVERELGRDSGHIIIDEFCGYLISVLLLKRTVAVVIIAFFVFRAFDIIKPPPVRTVERRIGGGAGVMLDDVVAGIYTNICMQLIYHLYLS